MILYRDGVKVNSATWTGTAPINWWADNAYIGNAPSSSQYWIGKIDTVKVFNYAQTPAQVAWDYNHGGPVGWYKFNECTGTTLHDSTSATNSATLTLGSLTAGTCSDGTNTTVWNKGATGKYGAALYFDGANDYASVATGLNNVSAVSFWVKPSTTTQSFLQLSANGTVTSSSGTVSAGSDFASPTIYVDGTAGTTLPSDSSWHQITVVTNSSFSANAIKFGQVGSTDYSGYLDDVRIFDYPLTAVQVKTLYNENSAVRFGP